MLSFYLQFDPTNSPAWIKYAEVETQLEDFNRTRGIFELGVSQPQLSMPMDGTTHLVIRIPTPPSLLSPQHAALEH